MQNNSAIKALMDLILEVEDYKDFLTEFFEINIRNGNSPQNLIDFNEQFMYVFKGNPYLWVEYFKDNNFIPLSELGISSTRYNAVYKLLRKIKSLYGQRYMRLVSQSRDPFMLVGTDINIKGNDTTHTMTIIRGDLERLQFNFNAETLLGTMAGMQQSIIQLINTGLFMLSDDNVQNYLSISNELNKTLQSLVVNGVETATEEKE